MPSENLILAATTSPGLESILKSELSRLKAEDIHAAERIVFFGWNREMIARANLSLRSAQRVYLSVAEWRVDTFDDLFELAWKTDWKGFLPTRVPISVRAVSEKSALTSLPAIQKTVKKAIVDRIAGRGQILEEDDSLEEVGILVLIRENHVHLLLDTTWEALHKRGYRTDAGEAPIKETLAAALVILANWRYRETFLDPFCGSGTIAIEAAMIARNIAPGLYRYFAFEQFPWMSETILETLRKEAEAAIIKDRTYDIRASDINPAMIEIARENAKRAGVGKDITFSVADVRSYAETRGLTGVMVSNPPYGLRLTDPDLDGIYKAIAEIIRGNHALLGGIITSYPDFTKFLKGAGEWSNRKLRNGSEEVRWIFRK